VQQFLLDILNTNTSKAHIARMLSNKGIRWEKFVYTASGYLLLPSVYYRLKALNLTHLLPEDLKAYLEHFCSINYNRNKNLLDEAQAISRLLQKNNIPHVFIKGIALLASDIYDSMGSRMIGDIDLLIENANIPKAMALIKDFGYSKQEGFAYYNIGFRHEDRLIDTSKLAAIEIHNQILNRPYQDLIKPKDVLQHSIIKSGLPVPQSYYNCIIQVLTHQINDDGYFFNRIYPKSLYDTHLLHISKNKEAIDYLNKNKFGKAYLDLYAYCMQGKTAKDKSLRLRRFILKQKYKFIRQFSFALKNTYSHIFSRLKQFVKNPYYRRHAIRLLLKPSFLEKLKK
jgi:hypothetical protein